jgi:imidazolonepropionase-like amidohydrolase
MVTAINDVQIFDGDRVLDERTVVLDGALISAIGGPVPPGAVILDGAGGTLLPGLIDSHTHTSMDSLRLALLFGVTTELEMMGHWSAQDRQRVLDQDDVADVRSAGMAITPPGGHPSEYLIAAGDAPSSGAESEDSHHDGPPPGWEYPFCSTAGDVVKFVEDSVAEGSDYIKIMIEDGTVVGYPGLTMISDEVLAVAVREAHRHEKLAIAHATTLEGAQRAVAAGVDGLGHMFVDRPHTADLIRAAAASGTFVIPTLTVLSSATGHPGAAFAADPRVSSRLSAQWLATLSGSADAYLQGNLDDALATVAALHAAGVDILAGTDVSEANPAFGGMAHGASVHHELQLLVQAGLTPLQALRSATSVPARRFALTDRGRITPGALADLLLVDGDPTTTISDTLSMRAVWRRGVLQNAS